MTSKTRPLTPPLNHGDEVIAVASSSALEDEKALLEGLNVLEEWGLLSRPQNLSGRRWGDFAGNDQQRNADLNPQIAAPLMYFVRGGWGAARLLEMPQKWNSGWVVGFSDVTAILWSRMAAGFDGGIHGPLLTTLANEPEWSKSRLKSLLFGKPIPDLKGTSWREGTATGPLVVGNLTVASHLLGTSHIPNLKNALLIFEDINEAPYKIDRMLTQWRLAGILQEISGIGFGSFKNCENLDVPNNTHSFTVEEVLKERTADLDIPIVGNLPIGHLCGNAALPLGRTAHLDGNKGQLSLSP